MSDKEKMDAALDRILAFRPKSENPKLELKKKKDDKPNFLEFFAGSGLVAQALKAYFNPLWANDICPKKAAVYTANHGHDNFFLGSIADIKAQDVPSATLSWASFPCQDLSLAGLNGGINAKRSGLVWEWLRIMDEMPRRPPLLVAENVTGLLSSEGGNHYRILHNALRERGYIVGAVVLDAINWVPHSRPRVFVIAVNESTTIPSKLIDTAPNWAHPPYLVNATRDLDGFIFWKIPEPKKRSIKLSALIDWNAPTDNKIAAY